MRAKSYFDRTKMNIDVTVKHSYEVLKPFFVSDKDRNDRLSILRKQGVRSIDDERPHRETRCK